MAIITSDLKKEQSFGRSLRSFTYWLIPIICFYLLYSSGVLTNPLTLFDSDVTNITNGDGIYKRDDSSESKKSKSPLDLIGVRIVIGFGVFAVINVVVITVHHIVQKVSKSQNSYKEIEHVYSPY